jgi:hypothetical protein
MIVDCYDPVNLFEMVPKLRLEMEPELWPSSTGSWRTTPSLCERVEKDLSKRGIPTLCNARQAAFHPYGGRPVHAGSQEALPLHLRANRTDSLRLYRLERVLPSVLRTSSG